MIEDKYLIVIGGPTAVGKTSTSIALAQHLDCDIISADSRQFYREMEIGTAKPSKEELSQATHHFIDSLSIHDEFSVGKFESETITLLDTLFKEKSHCILTGGSGLYLNAIVNGLDKFPDIAPSYRAELNEEFKKDGFSNLLKELSERDTEYFAKVDQQNPQRIIRALEIIRATGKPFSSFLRREPIQRPFKSILFKLEMEREILYERINTRVDIMLNQGLKEEAKSLFPLRHLNALRTVGYSEWFDFFESKIGEDKAIELIKRNSRRYAKRQITWFKNQGDYQAIAQDDKALNKIVQKLADFA